MNKKSQICATGMAMFAMFFGAGNAIFPLTIGHYAQNKTVFGIAGLLVTGVIVPFAGLVAMLLFNGDYMRFFGRIGKIPGFVVASFIMALIGPLGATPRCVAASYSTLKVVVPTLSAPLFSFGACAVIFAFTVRKSRIVDLIGCVLTPLLLVFLGWIIIEGLWSAEAMPASDLSPVDAFTYGLNEGYQTMDLLGALFFAPVILASFHSERPGSSSLFKMVLLSSAIGAGLLALTYTGFCLLTAFHGHGIVVGGSEELIGAVAVQIVGPAAGIVVAMIVALACLTTAIALTTVFAEFLHADICRHAISYRAAIMIALAVTFFFSILEFSGITAFLGPILQICYPMLIALTCVNLAQGFAQRSTVALSTTR